MEAWEKPHKLETQGGQNLFKLLWHMLRKTVSLSILKFGAVKKTSEPAFWKLTAATKLS